MGEDIATISVGNMPLFTVDAVESLKNNKAQHNPQLELKILNNCLFSELWKR